MKTTAIMNLKGGAAKTITAVKAARIAASRDYGKFVIEYLEGGAQHGR